MVRLLAVSDAPDRSVPLNDAFGLMTGAVALLLLFLLGVLALTAARRMRAGRSASRGVSDHHRFVDAWAMAGARAQRESDPGDADPGDDTVDLDPGDGPSMGWQ